MNCKINMTQYPIVGGKREEMVRAICAKYNPNDVGSRIHGVRLDAGYLYAHEKNRYVGFDHDLPERVIHFNDYDLPEVTAEEYLHNGLPVDAVKQLDSYEPVPVGPSVGDMVESGLLSKPHVYKPCDYDESTLRKALEPIPIPIENPYFSMRDQIQKEFAQAMAVRFDQLMVELSDTDDEPTTDAVLPAAALCVPDIPSR